MFIQIKTIIRLVVLIIILACVWFIGNFFVNMYQSLDYTPERTVAKYINLIESPTPDQLTSQDKKVLTQVMENSGIEQTIFQSNQNQLKSIRRDLNDMQLTVGAIEYIGEDKAIIEVMNMSKDVDTQLESSTDEGSSLLTFYLQKTGNWYSGVRWQVYGIEQASIVNTTDSIRDRVDSFLDNIKNQISGNESQSDSLGVESDSSSSGNSNRSF